MNSTMKVSKPEEIEFTLTVTMKLKEWLELQEQMGSEWPAHRLSMEISDMSIRARKIFWPEVTEPTP